MRAVLGLLRRPAFAVANAVAAAMNFGSLGLLFLLSLFLQTVQQRSASAAGAAVLPLFLPLVVLAPFAGRATARWGARPTMLAGLGVAAAGGRAACVVGLRRPRTTGSCPRCWRGESDWACSPPRSSRRPSRPSRRSTRGSPRAINNTARQAGGVAGVALYGSVAGAPADPARFLAGLHLTGLITAGLFVAAGVATAIAVPTRL